MQTGDAPAPEEAGTGYEGAPVAGAVLATVFFPFIALIAALLLQGSETNPQKKAQLRTWAWLSGGWLAFGVVLVILAVGAFSSASSGVGVSRSGPCQGGPDPGAAGRNIPGTNKYVFPCAFGGTETTRLPTP